MFIHVLSDLIQSIGVAIVGLLIWIFGDRVRILDPIITLFFCVLVVWSTVGVTKDTLVILMDAVPKVRGCDPRLFSVLSGD